MNPYRFAFPLALSLACFTIASSCSNPPPKPTTKTEESKTSAPPAYFKVDEQTASTIAGKVSFTGKRPPLKQVDLSEDPECAKLHRKPVYDQSLVVSRDGRLANAFV